MKYNDCIETLKLPGLICIIHSQPLQPLKLYLFSWLACKTLELFASLFSLPALSGTPLNMKKLRRLIDVSLSQRHQLHSFGLVSEWSSSFPPFRKSLTLEWRGRDLMSSTTNQHLTFFLSLFPPLAKESFSIWNLQCLFYLLWPSKVHPCVALGHRHRRLLSISFPLQLHIHALSCPEDVFLMIQKNNFFYLLRGVLDALSLQLFFFFSQYTEMFTLRDSTACCYDWQNWLVRGITWKT